MPAVSQAQQRFMGMVYKHKTDGGPAPSKAVGKAAKSMTTSQAHDFAKTKHKGLPKKVSEALFKSDELNEAMTSNLNCFSDKCSGRTKKHDKQSDGSMKCTNCGRVKQAKEKEPVLAAAESIFKSGIQTRSPKFNQFFHQAISNV
jgi:hypothetical protein